MKVRVDQDKCIGCGLCMSIADAVFAYNDDGKAVAGDVSVDDEDAVKEAVASCPAEAIEAE